jgi:cell division protein FtsB
VAWLMGLLDTRKRLRQQRRQITELETENAALRAQNQSMREGMRRCVTCEYRIDFKNRQGQAPVEKTPSE